MPTAVCPSCKFAGNVPAGFSNQPIRCRQCGNQFNPGLDFAGGGGVLPSLNSPVPAPVVARQQPPGTYPGEPWYYGYCHIVTVVLLGIDLALLSLGVVLYVLMGVYAVVIADDSGKALQGYLFGTILYAGMTLFIVLSTLYFFAFVLIFIDAARHVRRIHAAVAAQN